MDLFASDSDWESSSDSGMEDQEELDFLYGGQAQSIFSSLEQSIEKIDDFLSFERGFMHGDMVLSVTDPSGQMGRVVGIDMLVDLENVQGKIVKNVNSKSLSKIRSFSVGDFVVCGPWLGKVARVIDHVTVVLDDGTKFEVNTMDQDKLLPISPNILEDSQYPYYPGQRVKVKLSNGSNSARWLCGTWRAHQDEGTVCGVEAGLVYVDWLASLLTPNNPDLPSPPRVLNSKKLTLLSCFLHENWQLGDWCILPISGLASSTQTHMNTHKTFERGLGRNSGSNIEEIFVIVKTKTKIDVVWQDGSTSLGLDSPMLLPASVVNSYEFFPQQFIQEKSTCDDPNTFNSQRWGVVLGVDAKERTVKVQWRTVTVTTPEPKNLDDEHTVETVSAYELIEHPEYCYCFGDLVFRLVHNQLDDEADKDHSNTEFSKREEGTNDYMNKFSDTCYLSCIGNVTGFEDGGVEVRWANGITSKVAPYELVRVDKNEGSAAISVDEESEDSNEDMIEHDKQFSRDKKMDLLNSSDVVGGDCKKHLWETTSFSLPQAAIGFFTSIAASLLGTFDSKFDPDSTPLVQLPEIRSESGISKAKDVLEGDDLCSEPELIAEFSTFGNRHVNQEAKQIQEDKDLPHVTENDNLNKFSQFDMVADCSDHHFLDTGAGFTLSQAKRSWLKKVHQEWSILEKNLPETIYVRIFEERMDIIRAAIIGAPGTPYHDGLFFFDIYLPPEYPHVPPMVHYNSGGLRLNPNLYESGKVCLSLLNTWTGSDTEVWSENSTILQVLLSLQALVLNEKPYFNEAGYDQQIGRAEGEKNSVSYNENAFLGTCRSMLYLLRRPPKHFEGLVDEHFSKRSHQILMACKAYMEGAPVGCGKTEEDPPKLSSTGFKLMLSKIFPKLVEAFSSKGIDFSKVTLPE